MEGHSAGAKSRKNVGKVSKNPAAKMTVPYEHRLGVLAEVGADRSSSARGVLEVGSRTWTSPGYDFEDGAALVDPDGVLPPISSFKVPEDKTPTTAITLTSVSRE